MKKTISVVAIISLLAMGGYMFFEPTLSSASGGPGVGPYDDLITVTQSVTSEISIDAPANVTMSGTIPSITGNPGVPRTGSVTWKVITGNVEGFNLTLKASTSPAMRLDGSGDIFTYFSNYTPVATSTPDFDWTSPATSQAEFGYTVEPATVADTVAKFRDDGSACGTGALNTASKCWYLTTTGGEQIINRSSNTLEAGEDEVVRFNTESNAKLLKEGSYVAEITVTATQN